MGAVTKNNLGVLTCELENRLFTWHCRWGHLKSPNHMIGMPGPFAGRGLHTRSVLVHGLLEIHHAQGFVQRLLRHLCWSKTHTCKIDSLMISRTSSFRWRRMGLTSFYHEVSFEVKTQRLKTNPLKECFATWQCEISLKQIHWKNVLRHGNVR